MDFTKILSVFFLSLIYSSKIVAQNVHSKCLEADSRSKLSFVASGFSNKQMNGIYLTKITYDHFINDEPIFENAYGYCSWYSIQRKSWVITNCNDITADDVFIGYIFDEVCKTACPYNPASYDKLIWKHGAKTFIRKQKRRKIVQRIASANVLRFATSAAGIFSIKRRNSSFKFRSFCQKWKFSKRTGRLRCVKRQRRKWKLQLES